MSATLGFIKFQKIKLAAVSFSLYTLAFIFSTSARAEYISCTSVQLRTTTGEQSKIILRIGALVSIDTAVLKADLEGDWISVDSYAYGSGWAKRHCVSKNKPSLRDIQAEYAALNKNDWKNQLEVAKKATELLPIEPWGWQMQLRAATQTGQKNLADQVTSALDLLQNKSAMDKKPSILAVAMLPANAYNVYRKDPGILVAEWANYSSETPSDLNILYDLNGNRLGVTGFDQREKNDCDFTDEYVRYRLDKGKKLSDMMLISDSVLHPRLPDQIKLSPLEEKKIRKLAIDTMVSFGMPRRIASDAAKREKSDDNYFNIDAFDYNHDGRLDALISAQFTQRTLENPDHSATEQHRTQNYSLLMLAQNDGNGRYSVNLKEWSIGKQDTSANSYDDIYANTLKYLTHLDLDGDGLDEILVRSSSVIAGHILFQRKTDNSEWKAIDFEGKGCD